MDYCRYVVADGDVALRSVVRDVGGRECVVATWTVVLRPSRDVSGPCSAKSTSRCVQPQDGDEYVWFRYRGRYYVYRRDIYTRFERAVLDAFAENRFVVVMLAGASRTGKTTLPQLVAEKYGIPAQVVSAASLLSMYVGESERLVASTISRVHGAVVVLDEADAIFPGVSRYATVSESGVPENVKTLNAFLVAVDQRRRRPGAGVLVLTTNVPTKNFPQEVQNRADYIDEFPRPSLEALRLYARLVGMEAAEIPPLSDFATLESCWRYGICEPPRYVVVPERPPPSTAMYRAVVDRLRKLVQSTAPFYVKTKRQDPLEAVKIVATLVQKPAVVARTRQEYYELVQQGKYLDAVVCPLPWTISREDTYAGLGRAPVAFPGWTPANEIEVVEVPELV